MHDAVAFVILAGVVIAGYRAVRRQEDEPYVLRRLSASKSEAVSGASTGLTNASRAGDRHHIIARDEGAGAS
jgi:hypothetical protein